MADLKDFTPKTVDEFLNGVESEIGADLLGVWNTQKARLERNLRILGETTIRMGSLLATGQISAAEADAIIYQQEQLFNATLNHVAALTYIAAQTILNTIFKVVGWVIFNYTGVNLFPALVAP